MPTENHDNIDSFVLPPMGRQATRRRAVTSPQDESNYRPSKQHEGEPSLLFPKKNILMEYVESIMYGGMYVLDPTLLLYREGEIDSDYVIGLQKKKKKKCLQHNTTRRKQRAPLLSNKIDPDPTRPARLTGERGTKNLRSRS